MRVLLSGGRILDPAVEMDQVGSVLIEDDAIVEIGEIVAEDVEADVVY
ncbi:MAG: dihydroorotase, partial [Verrucomicrobiaceae bacterium]